MRKIFEVPSYITELKMYRLIFIDCNFFFSFHHTLKASGWWFQSLLVVSCTSGKMTQCMHCVGNPGLI